ncbi:MAG: hypothetical protein JXD23_16740 [Spirochaetales bacterium]|nr:hypothetical protein [Spirochaetales bacterium]
MKNRLFALVLFFALPAALIADETPPDNTETPQRDPFLFTFGLRLLGADIGLGWRGLTKPPAPDTIIWLIAGGGYEWLNYFRLPDDTLYTGGGGYTPSYTRACGRLDLGLAQGIVWNERLKFNLFEVYGFFRTRLDHAIDDPAVNELFLASGKPYEPDLFQASLFTGVSYNDLDKTDPHWKLNGLYVETSVEWGPQWLLNDLLGRSDFVRLNLTASGFLALFDANPDAELGTVSGYAGAFLSVDWCGGGAVPANIQQTLGGRGYRYAMGYAVRGYEDARFDGRFKAVLNLEFRLNLWQFKIIDTFTPGLYAFFDSGYYNFIYYPEQGFLFSTGAGVYLNVWRLTTLTAYVVMPLSHPMMDGVTWLHIGVGLDAHF